MVNRSVNTQFRDIYELFLSSIQDYRIRNLFAEDEEVAKDLLEMFLLRAIPQFKGCVKNIYEVDMLGKSFYVELDLEEKRILADFMLLSWMDYVVNDITQMNLSLNDNDFKHFSEEKNLREKSMYADRIREKVFQSVTVYLLYKTPFKEWGVGNFYGD